MSWADLLTYWRSKHAGGLPPSRARLDPVAEIPRLVRSLMLIDRPTEGYRFRLIGSEIVTRAGGDGTGKLVKDAPYPAAILDPWTASMDSAAQTGEPQLTRLHMKGGGSILTLMLPLASTDGGMIEMLLGGAFAERAGEGFWHPEAVERLDIAALSADGGVAGPTSGWENPLRPKWV